MEPSSDWITCTTTPAPKAHGSVGRGTESLSQPEKLWVVSPRHPSISWKLQPCHLTRRVAKHDPSKDHTKRHGNVEEGALMGSQTSTKIYKQLWKAECRLNSFPQRRGCSLVIPYRVVSPESVHTSNSVRTVQIIFFYLGTHRETYNN